MKLVFKLIAYSKKYWNYLFFGMVGIIGTSICQLYAPLIVRDLTGLAIDGDPDMAVKALRMGLILLAVYLFQGVFSFMRSYLTHYAAWHFVRDMRVTVYDKLQQLSLKFYHDKQTGQLMSRVVNDTGNIETLIAHAVPDIIINVLILVGVAAILFMINPILALLSLVSIPFIILFARLYVKKAMPYFRKMQELMGELNANLQDNISGMKEIQIFNQQGREKGRIFSSAQSHIAAMLTALRYSSGYHAAIQFFSQTGTVFVIGYGGYLAAGGRLPVQDIVAFVMYLGIFYQPVTSLARVSEDLQTAIAGAERVFYILDEEPDVKEAENPVELADVRGDIVFKNVSFNYIEGIEVLKEIDVEIESGEIIALVGPTGVGKTTFISLLNRFYDPEEGEIYLDGVNIKDAALRSLRDNISNVLQDVFLFNGTVAENIGYGRDGATIGQIIEAAKVARADEFINGFENGYDTLIGERGIRLSGGQKQRISIARAVLRDTPVLILDEATSSVDVETEKLVHEAMDHIMEHRTTIIIAHRLSTVKKADKIIVMEDGRIAEMGTHEELLKSGGLYERLINIQNSGMS